LLYNPLNRRLLKERAGDVWFISGDGHYRKAKMTGELQTYGWTVAALFENPDAAHGRWRLYNESELTRPAFPICGARPMP
jgi:hypothetical protein